MTTGLHQLVGGLRAMADPSRLRLLAVLRNQASVLADFSRIEA